MSGLSSGERAQIRRTMRRDPHAYSEATRIAHSPVIDPFSASIDVALETRKKRLVLQKATANFLGGLDEEITDNDYYESSLAYLAREFESFGDSRGGYRVGVDFMTNQPRYRPRS